MPCSSTNASAMADRPRPRRRSAVGWVSIVLSLMIVAGTADVLVQQAGCLGRVGGPVLAVLQNGGDRGVGARAGRQRPRTGGSDPLRAVLLHQAQDGRN